MTNPWELSPEQIHKLILAGVEPDEIPELNETRHDTYVQLMAEVYGEDPVETAEGHFHAKYGFEHICHCVDDMFTDNTVRIPRCRYDMGDDALEALEKVNVERDELADAVNQLRDQVIFLGTTPVV